MRAVGRGPGRDAHSEGIVGAYLVNTGRAREGLTFRKSARDSDPLSLGWSGHVMGSYYTLGLWESYDAEYERSRDLEGGRGHLESGQVMRLLLTHASAATIKTQFDRVLEWPDAPGLMRALARVHASPEKALAVLRQHLDGPPAQLFMLAELAGVYGDTDLAIEALQKATPDARLVLIQQFWLPELSAARKDPRFKVLLREVGLPQFWRASGKWGDFARPLGTDDFDVW